MAEFQKVQFRNFNGAKLVGISAVHSIRTDATNPIPGLWEKCFSENAFDVLKNSRPVNDSYVGWMGEFDNATGRFTYIAGMLLPVDATVPEGYESRNLSPCRIGVGWVKGKAPDIYINAHTLTETGIEDSVYEIDPSQGYSMEVYHPKRFTEAMEKGRKEVILDYWIPVKHRVTKYYESGRRPYRIVRSLFEALLANDVPEDRIDRIMKGCGDITDKTNQAKRAAWVAQAMDRLDHEFPVEERRRIRESSACCLGGKREKLSKAIAKGGSLEERVAVANRTSLVFGHGVKLLEDGRIQVQFAPDGKESYSCVCLKGTQEPMSTTYCMCCGGHIKHHLQTALERELECEIIQTSLTTGGKKPCTMAFTVVS